MACHLAGEGTAVATCGTAFATDHIRIVRRLIGDDRNSGGRVIFTFDGDAAGQKAALRAFEEDQRFVAQTYIALAPKGLDPCDLRLQQGNEAVRELIATRRPMFEFKIQSIMKEVDLSTAEGRVQGLRLAAPVVAGIKDPALRPEYARELAGWLGMEVEPVKQAVNRALRDLRSGTPSGADRGRRDAPGQSGPGSAFSGNGRRNEGPAGGVRQPDGSFLLPDGSYHLPPAERSRSGSAEKVRGPQFRGR